MRTAFLIILCSICWSAPAGALEIRFLATVVVDSSELVLGDLVEFEGQHECFNTLQIQRVGKAPAPGKSASLAARTIIQNIYRQIHDLPEINWTGQATIVVQRSGRKITATEIDRIIGDYLTNKADQFSPAQLRHTIESLPAPFFLPTGPFVCDVIPANPQIIGSKRVVLIFKVNGRVIKNLSIRCRIDAYATVVAARDRIKYGTVLEPSQLLLTTLKVSKLAGYATAIDQVVGTITKRTIRKGMAIERVMIESAPVVRRGELVKIIINYQGLLLTATGVAKASGRKNEVIRVRNSSSNKIIPCRVHAPGLVKVTW